MVKTDLCQLDRLVMSDEVLNDPHHQTIRLHSDLLTGIEALCCQSFHLLGFVEHS